MAHTRTHCVSREYLEDMKEEPNYAESTLTETMVARIEIEELGNPANQKQITDALEALDGVIESKIEKGALHVSYDSLGTTEKKIEEAIRSTGNTVKAAAADTETPHPDLSAPAHGEPSHDENLHDGERS